MSRCMVLPYKLNLEYQIACLKKYGTHPRWLKLGLLWIRDSWPIVIGGFKWRSDLGTPPRAKISETCHFHLFLLLPFQRWFQIRLFRLFPPFSAFPPFRLFSSSFNAIANCLFSLVNKAFQRYPLVFYYGQSIPMLLLCFLLQTKMTLLLLLMIHASIARDLLVRMWRGACF